MPGHAAASRFSASRSNLPSGACAITAFGMPLSRISAASARVSTPLMAMMPRAFSQASRSCVDAIVGRLGDRRPEHAAAHAAGRQAPQLHVFGIGADIADMREGEGDDLPGIRRVGQDLLIAGHRGIEADLADGDAGGARALALDHRAVGQNEKRGRRLDRPIGRRARHCGLFGQRFTCVVHLLLEARVRRERPVCKFGCAARSRQGCGERARVVSMARLNPRGVCGSIHRSNYLPVKTMA